MWRLRSADEHPELFAATARVLQQCGDIVFPQGASPIEGARRDVKELLEALVTIADCHGERVATLSVTKAPVVQAAAKPSPYVELDQIQVSDPWAAAAAKLAPRPAVQAAAPPTSAAMAASSPRAPSSASSVGSRAKSSPMPSLAAMSTAAPAMVAAVAGDACSGGSVMLFVGPTHEAVSFANKLGFGAPPPLSRPLTCEHNLDHRGYIVADSALPGSLPGTSCATSTTPVSAAVPYAVPIANSELPGSLPGPTSSSKATSTSADFWLTLPGDGDWVPVTEVSRRDGALARTCAEIFVFNTADDGTKHKYFLPVGTICKLVMSLHEEVMIQAYDEVYPGKFAPELVEGWVVLRPGDAEVWRPSSASSPEAIAARALRALRREGAAAG
jgi:hypothetical protein